MHPSTGAHDARSFFAELARESRTGHFWMMVARNAVPPLGVIALGWPALQAAVLFVLESWVFLSLRCGIEMASCVPSGPWAKPPNLQGVSRGWLFQTRTTGVSRGHGCFVGCNAARS